MGIIDELFFGERRRGERFAREFEDAQGTAGIAAIGKKGFLVESPDNRVSSFLAARAVKDVTGSLPRGLAVRLNPNSTLVPFSSSEGKNIRDVFADNKIGVGTPIGTTLSALQADARTRGAKSTNQLLQQLANSSLRSKKANSVPTLRFLDDYFKGTEGNGLSRNN